MKLLTFANHKTIKGLKKGYSTAILHLSPHTSAGLKTEGNQLFNTCPKAGKCITACLNYAGYGRFETVQTARRNRTAMYLRDPSAFYSQLERELVNAGRRAKRSGHHFTFRPNGTSDIPALGAWAAETFPELQVYDYTKIPQPWKRQRANYHLTFSWEGSNWSSCKAALKHDINVAVPFLGAMPSSFKGFPVISGDDTDLRFLDPQGVIVGLSAKGPAKFEQSNFVIKPTA